MQALTFLQPDGLHRSRGYSHVAVTSGPLVHIAGQVAVDDSGATVGAGDFGVQVERALANLDLALVACGSDFGSVAAMTIYVVASVPRAELSKLREPLATRASSRPLPAITLVIVHALLDPDWLVEVQGVAALPDPYTRKEKIMLELGA